MHDPRLDSDNPAALDEFYPHLHGIREEVEYPEVQGIRLYHNRNTIHFPSHGHSAIEIL